MQLLWYFFSLIFSTDLRITSTLQNQVQEINEWNCILENQFFQKMVASNHAIIRFRDILSSAHLSKYLKRSALSLKSL
jgi:hypothetical protein